jgi:hypothetical protein
MTIGSDPSIFLECPCIAFLGHARVTSHLRMIDSFDSNGKFRLAFSSQTTRPSVIPRNGFNSKEKSMAPAKLSFPVQNRIIIRTIFIPPCTCNSHSDHPKIGAIDTDERWPRTTKENERPHNQ